LRVYTWVMANTWMSHVTRMNVTRGHCECIRESWYTHEWVMSLVWTSHWALVSHGTHMNESWHTYEWVMPHIWMSHTGPLRVYTWVMAHMWMSCDTHTFKWVMAHIWWSHVTNTNVMLWPLQLYAGVLARVWMSNSKCTSESCHTYGWVMSHIIWGLAPAWMSHYGHCKCVCLRVCVLMWCYVHEHNCIIWVTRMNEPRLR